jgi:hypothetical protein
MLKRLGFALLCTLLALPALLPLRAGAAENVRVRGVIETFAGGVLTIKTRTGETVQVHLGEKVGVRVVVKASLEDIKVNTYVGAAALPMPDGRLKALEVLIFPEAARGSNEGHYPWDLLPESTMTNATVAETVSGVDGRELTLKYKGGEKKLVVPPEAPIVTFAPGDASMLTPGTVVIVFGSREDDGRLTGRAVAVGRDGVNPPM